jgi:hypothetical protein
MLLADQVPSKGLDGRTARRPVSNNFDQQKSRHEDGFFARLPVITSSLQQQVQQVQQRQPLELQQQVLQQQERQPLELQQQELQEQEQRLLLFCRKQPEPGRAEKRSATIFS